jgi:hypothetical protein
LEGVKIPWFWDLFLVGRDARKGWIGAGFVSFDWLSAVGKSQFGGLTSENAEVFGGLEMKALCRRVIWVRGSAAALFYGT